MGTATLLPQTSQAQTFETNPYSKIGMTVRQFNDSYAREDVGGMIGVEFGFVQNVAKDLRGELYESTVWKKFDNEKITAFELGAFFDYAPGDFYLRIGPKIGFVSVDSNSETGFGLAGRIGFNISIGGKSDLYFEYNYSNLKAGESGDKYDVGTRGVSIGLKF